jgi:hypothetical protein
VRVLKLCHWLMWHYCFQGHSRCSYCPSFYEPYASSNRYILCTPICSSNHKPQIVPCDHPPIACIGSANRVKAISDRVPIDPKLWWIMPAFDPYNITFVLLWLRCGLPPAPVAVRSRHDVTTSWRHTSTHDRFKYDVIYNGFAAKFIKNALKTLNKVNF